MIKKFWTPVSTPPPKSGIYFVYVDGYGIDVAVWDALVPCWTYSRLSSKHIDGAITAKNITHWSEK
jgi:hypothetical protein